jgi:hypothetical protein
LIPELEKTSLLTTGNECPGSGSTVSTDSFAGASGVGDKTWLPVDGFKVGEGDVSITGVGGTVDQQASETMLSAAIRAKILE